MTAKEVKIIEVSSTTDLPPKYRGYPKCLYTLRDAVESFQRKTGVAPVEVYSYERGIISNWCVEVEE